MDYFVVLLHLVFAVKPVVVVHAEQDAMDHSVSMYRKHDMMITMYPPFVGNENMSRNTYIIPWDYFALFVAVAVHYSY